MSWVKNSPSLSWLPWQLADSMLRNRKIIKWESWFVILSKSLSKRHHSRSSEFEVLPSMVPWLKTYSRHSIGAHWPPWQISDSLLALRFSKTVTTWGSFARSWRGRHVSHTLTSEAVISPWQLNSRSEARVNRALIAIYDERHSS